MIAALAAFVSVALVVVLWRAPWLVVKPSIQFIVAANVLIQWPLAWFQDRLFEGIPSPTMVAMWVALPLVCALAWMPFVGGPTCVAIWSRAQKVTSELSFQASTLRVLLPLWGVAVCITLWYLRAVPFSKTGLYAIIAHPAMAALAREDSLKLLTNRYLAYTYLSMGLVVCPLICALSARLALMAWRQGRYVMVALWFGSLGLSLFAASLSGARSVPAKAILVVLLARLFEGGARIHIRRLVAIPVVALLPVVLLTISREGKHVDAALLGKYLTSVVMDRALFVPSQVGILHLRYAEERGPFGVAAVPRLAAIEGIESVNPANVIGRHYFADAGPTMSANASFLFTYISYFGTLGVFVNVALVALLEVTLFILRRTGPTLLGPTMALFAVASLGYLSSDFTTVLVSGGVLLSGLIALVATWWLGESTNAAPLAAAQTT